MSTHTVAGLWRYPVKSMGGEELSEAMMGADGVFGDRRWAVRDEERRAIAEARKLPALLSMSARYSTGEIASPVRISLPDGAEVRSGEPEAHRALSAALGREVTLWPRLPASETEHYRRDVPEDGVEAHLLELFGVDRPEDLPDLSAMPEELYDHQTIPGTYFDWAPVHLITDRSLETLRTLAPGSDVDVRRFRPNVLVSAGEDEPGEFPEMEWPGRVLRVGTAVLRVTARTPRCAMISHPQDGLPKDRELARVVHRKAAHEVGVYATVEEPGMAYPGDAVEILESPHE